VQFNISWANSWRDASNYDAAWVFAKYSTDGATWKHLTLKSSGTNPSGFVTGSGTSIQIVVPTDKLGCFIQRSGTGTGTLTTTGINLVWDYGTDGLGDSDIFTANMRLKVFAIEMVYIPAASFYIGDGNGTTESAYAFHNGTSNSAAFIATSLTRNIRVDPGNDDAQITSTGAGFGIGIGGSGVWSGLDTNNDGTIDNASFPTGYNPFYIMKYELTEGQWVEFFNLLTASQKSANDLTGTSGKNSQAVAARNTIAWPGSGDATTTRPERACSYLTWQNVCAYADWAGLRPMTELEFEKAARGTTAPVLNEYAWGTTGATQATTISGTENGTETITNSGANSNGLSYVNLTGGDGSQGPLRAGIFATGSSTRTQAGAGYYGSMELSGNLFERAVSVGNSSGRSFAGTLGDGSLTGSGYASNTDWPGYVSGSGVSNSNAGGGFRGGGWSAAALFSQTSDRNYASKTSSVNNSFNGGRLVRTSP
jgi:formylglycine-generating enzyme required for sulfatase activity